MFYLAFNLRTWEIFPGLDQVVEIKYLSEELLQRFMKQD